MAYLEFFVGSAFGVQNRGTPKAITAAGRQNIPFVNLWQAFGGTNRLNMPFLSGRGRIAGTVKVLSDLVPNRRVRLYHRESGRFVRETLSDANGAFSFTNVNHLETYYTIALDNPANYNADAIDYITPSL